MLREGRVVAGGHPREVLTPELIADVYGVRAVVSHDQAVGCSRVLFDAAPL
ncbi:iron-enterobactin transporter ATP-binding protein [Clavibacter michiganensis subsp. michiganensis]|nr:iron-enterobactin transporter ATP-binding protein [Clavibacter michiganensis subsp. michiganensis]